MELGSNFEKLNWFKCKWFAWSKFHTLAFWAEPSACFVSAFVKISFELIWKWLMTGRLSASAPKSDGCGAKVEIWIWIVDAALCCLGRPPVIDSSAAWGTSASAECRPRETSHRGVAVDGNLVDLFLSLFPFSPFNFFVSCSRNWRVDKSSRKEGRWTALS